MRRFPVALLCGLSAIALTFLLFFLIVDTALIDTIHYLALGGLVLSEIITMCYALGIKNNPRKVMTVAISAIMIPYALILGLIYIVASSTEYGYFLGWYCFGLVAINTPALLLLLTNARITHDDTKMQNAKSSMLHIRKMVKLVMTNPNAQPYEAQLRAMEEDLHFLNDSVISQEDEAIRQMVLQLHQNINDPAYDVQAQIDKIRQTIQIRKIMTSRTV